MTENAKAFYTAASQLSDSVCTVLCKINEETAENVTEIRLRANRFIVLTAQNSPVKLNIFTDKTDIDECFMALCGYSYQHVENYIAEGFIPMKNGHRAGICGTFYKNDAGEARIKDITSINIRVARTQITSCTEEFKKIIKESSGLLICGAPGCGKTTLLRAVFNYLSDCEKRVSIVDERFELVPTSKSGFAYTLPDNCDVLSGYPKHIGMLHAIRTLSPDVIICDEIGGMEDAAAVAKAANAGVVIIASIHGGGKNVLRRPQTAALIETGAFDCAVLIKPFGIIDEVIHLA